MLKKIVLVVVVIVVVLVIIIATRPAEYSVSRSATIAAPPGVVFTQVNNLRHWEAWSPWAKLDPEMRLTYAGPESGVGAGYTWAGNEDVGEGRMTIIETRPDELVRIQLEFFKPMKSVSDTRFEFEPEGDQTTVTWTMFGTNNFVGKAFCLIVDMDEMLGAEFEKGLAQMKAVAEAAAKE